MIRKITKSGLRRNLAQEVVPISFLRGLVSCKYIRKQLSEVVSLADSAGRASNKAVLDEAYGVLKIVGRTERHR